MTKRIDHKIKLVLLAIVLLFTLACEETSITTRVQADGSCIRTMVVESDSGKLGKKAFPIPLDQTWSYEYRKDESKEKKHIYTAQKTFPTVQDLNLEFLENPVKPPKIKREVIFEKNFQWFFTRYLYRETTHRVNPFQSIPLDSFFDSKEREVLEQWFDDEKELEEKFPKEILDKVENKFQEWYLRNLFAEIHPILVRGAENLNNPKLPASLLKEKEESLFQAFASETQALEDLKWDRVFEVLTKTLGTPLIKDIYQNEKKAFQEIDTKSKRLNNLLELGFTNRVAMPGIIVETNAEAVEGNKAGWEVEILRVLFTDFEMRVESRKVNWWMVWLTGGLVVILITLFIAATLRRYRNSR